MKYILTTSLLLFCLFSFSQSIATHAITPGKDTAIWSPAPKNMQALCVGWDTSKMHKVGINTTGDTIFGGWTMDTTDNIYKPSPGGLLIWDQEDTSAQFKTWPGQMPLQYQIGNGPMNDVHSSEDLQMMTTAIMLKILENLVEQVHTLEKQVKALQRKNNPVHRKPKGMGRKTTLLEY